MSEVAPGKCRSPGCPKDAEVWCEHVEFRTGSARIKPSEKWNGEFCMEHFTKVMALKVRELLPNEWIRVENLEWEYAV